MSVELNSHGVNKLIKATILSDEKMKEIGFHKNYYEGTKHEKYSPYWYFSRTLELPKDKKYHGFEISFNVNIPKDGSDIRIDVLDEDFCQPYDYQYMLENNQLLSYIELEKRQEGKEKKEIIERKCLYHYL